MRRLVVLVALVGVCVSATTAGAWSSVADVRDPLALILSSSDLPSGAEYSTMSLPGSTIEGLASIGIQARGATFHASVEIASTKLRSYDGAVFVTGSAAQAAKLYALSVREARKRPNKTTTLHLPRYGDAQLARFFVGASSVELLVRKKAVLWTLRIEGSGQLVRSEAELTADLKSRASRQARRLGAG
jgi:hypothetical protein